MIQAMEANLTEQTDKKILELMKSAAKANQGLSLLMDTYQEKLYWHIRGIVKHHEDADDVLQNTFIKVYRNIAGFKGDSRLYTWLYRIATNESITLLQRNQKKGMASIDEVSIQHTFQAEEQPSPEHIQHLLAKAIDELPAKQRAVFQLRYYDELSYEDIKHITGTSVGALKASYHHAVKKIQAAIRSMDV